MPAGATYEPIATSSSTTSPIEFTSISGSYTDLRIVITMLSTSSPGTSVNIQFNNDTGTTYSQQDIFSNASTPPTANRTSNDDRWYITGVTADATSTTMPLVSIIDVFSYAGSTFKSGLIRYGGDKNGSGRAAVRIGMWRSTSAITSIKIFCTNVTTGSQVTLYGIKAA